MNDPEAISIVSYDARYKNDFKRLNEAWISEHFAIEETEKCWIIPNGTSSIQAPAPSSHSGRQSPSLSCRSSHGSTSQHGGNSPGGVESTLPG